MWIWVWNQTPYRHFVSCMKKLIHTYTFRNVSIALMVIWLDNIYISIFFTVLIVLKVFLYAIWVYICITFNTAYTLLLLNTKKFFSNKIKFSQFNTYLYITYTYVLPYYCILDIIMCRQCCLIVLNWILQIRHTKLQHFPVKQVPHRCPI